jgi:hypothetical protein
MPLLVLVAEELLVAGCARAVCDAMRMEPLHARVRGMCRD